MTDSARLVASAAEIGAACWNSLANPQGLAEPHPFTTYEFFAALGTTLDHELARYDGVIFFESAAVGGMGIEGGNPVRHESLQQAVALDTKLRRLWSRHPRFVLVRHNASFLAKINFGLTELTAMVAELGARRTGSPGAR